jgi:RNA polymerase sigma-70 factor (ECF subfamily)
VSDDRPGADDQALIVEALRGDEEALGRLLTRDQEWAYNVAYRVLGQEADARDAVQDAFLLTVRALRGDGSPPRTHAAYRPWLRRVLVNSALTQVRRRPPVRAVPVDAVAESLPGPEHGEPGGSTDQAETRQQVLTALLALPQTQRVALALKEYLDASYEEIAETLGIPRTAVGTLLFRARAAFRVAYDHVAETAAPVECPDLVPLFSAIVDAEPRPAAWSQLEEHLGQCERCQGELERQRRARRLYALIPLAALPAGWDPVKAALGGAAASASSTASTLGGASASPGATSTTPVGGANGVAAGAGTTSGAGASGVPPLPPVADPGSAAVAGHAIGATAAPAAAAPVAASVPAAGTSAAATGGGVLAGAAGAKLTLAALATAGVIGAAVVASPLVGTGPEPAASPAPSPAIVLSTGASPVTASSPVARAGAAASPAPAGSTIGAIIVPAASPSPMAPLGTVAPAAPAPAPPSVPAPSPVPSPAAQASGPNRP